MIRWKNHDYADLCFKIRITRTRYTEPVEIVPDSGWTWYYVAEAEILLPSDLANPIARLSYRVDGKYYTGVFVPEGYKYRVYGVNCEHYGIETIEKAIELADELLSKAILGIRLTVNYPRFQKLEELKENEYAVFQGI